MRQLFQVLQKLRSCFCIRPSNKHSMREMEHFIPRAHLSREISYCFQQLLTPPPVQEFSCNANVVHMLGLRMITASPINYVHTWSTAFCSPLTLLPVTCSSSLTSTILLEMEETACVTGMSCNVRSLVAWRQRGGGGCRREQRHTQLLHSTLTTNPMPECCMPVSFLNTAHSVLPVPWHSSN